MLVNYPDPTNRLQFLECDELNVRYIVGRSL